MGSHLSEGWGCQSSVARLPCRVMPAWQPLMPEGQILLVSCRFWAASSGPVVERENSLPRDVGHSGRSNCCPADGHQPGWAYSFCGHQALCGQRSGTEGIVNFIACRMNYMFIVGHSPGGATDPHDGIPPFSAISGVGNGTNSTNDPSTNSQTFL